MYSIFTYIWLCFSVNVGKHTIHGSYGCAGVPSFLLFFVMTEICRFAGGVGLKSSYTLGVWLPVVWGHFLGHRIYFGAILGPCKAILG